MPNIRDPLTFSVLVEVTIDLPGDPGCEKRSRAAVMRHVEDAVKRWGGQHPPGDTFFPTNLKVKVY